MFTKLKIFAHIFAISLTSLLFANFLIWLLPNKGINWSSIKHLLNVFEVLAFAGPLTLGSAFPISLGMEVWEKNHKKLVNLAPILILVSAVLIIYLGYTADENIRPYFSFLGFPTILLAIQNIYWFSYKLILGIGAFINRWLTP